MPAAPLATADATPAAQPPDVASQTALVRTDLFSPVLPPAQRFTDAAQRSFLAFAQEASEENRFKYIESIVTFAQESTSLEHSDFAQKRLPFIARVAELDRSPLVRRAALSMLATHPHAPSHGFLWERIQGKGPSKTRPRAEVEERKVATLSLMRIARTDAECSALSERFTESVVQTLRPLLEERRAASEGWEGRTGPQGAGAPVPLPEDEEEVARALLFGAKWLSFGPRGADHLCRSHAKLINEEPEVYFQERDAFLDRAEAFFADVPDPRARLGVHCIRHIRQRDLPVFRSPHIGSAWDGNCINVRTVPGQLAFLEYTAAAHESEHSREEERARANGLRKPNPLDYPNDQARFVSLMSQHEGRVHATEAALIRATGFDQVLDLTPHWRAFLEAQTQAGREGVMDKVTELILQGGLLMEDGANYRQDYEQQWQSAQDLVAFEARRKLSF